MNHAQQAAKPDHKSTVLFISMSSAQNQQVNCKSLQCSFVAG